MSDKKKYSPKPGERSFTLLETVIALGLMVTIILEVSSVQGNAINFNTYARKATQASWLAKAIMSEIEYKAKFYPLKELKTDPTFKDRPISESLCPKGPIYDCDYTYTVTIEDFKLPIIEIMLGSKPKEGNDGQESAEDPMASFIQDKVKEILGEDVMKIAKVEVFWPEGALRSSVTLTYLLTNQNGLDEYIEQLPPLKDGKKQCPDGQEFKDGKCVKQAPAGPAGGPVGGAAGGATAPVDGEDRSPANPSGSGDGPPNGGSSGEDTQ